MNLKKTLTALLAGLLVCASVPLAISALEPHGTGIKMRSWLVNDPNYQFSEAYKTSVWYDNFTALKLSGNDRNNVLRIAVSQLGYHEGDSAADFDGMNANGTGNYIEYARLLVPNWNNNSYDWCACFVNWCLNQARFDKASSEISCGNWVAELKTMNMWQASAAYQGTYTPRPADFIFFNWDTDNTWPDHIGFVLYTTATHVYTVEGNADENVTVRSYALNDSRVIGYGTPPYDEGTEATIDYSYAGGMPKGTYTVNSRTASLTENPDSGVICAVPVGSSVELQEVEGDYAKVSYAGKTGFLPKNCLYLMTKAAGEETLTYDANGGQGAPATQKITIGEPITVTETTPTLEGDTFLGWSFAPYNMKVDFKAGERIFPTGDTVLYAVWEKRSAALAKEAAEKGLLPEYERPDGIRNSGALLLGSLNDISIFTDCKDTEVKLTEDAAEGRVLSFVSTAESSDPYVTLPYGTLCRSLRLAPVTGDQTAFVILRVKGVSMNNVSMELYFNGMDHKASSLLTANDEWQYVIFDMADSGFTEELDTLRIDWQQAGVRAGDTVLISDIYFASSAAVKDAILKGKYVYPHQELLDSVTEPGTETTDSSVGTAPDPESVTKDEPVTGSDPSSTDTSNVNSDTETKPTDTGCYSVLRTSAWVGMVLFACLPAILKKKED